MSRLELPHEFDFINLLAAHLKLFLILHYFNLHSIFLEHKLYLVSRARPFTNREGRKESGQIQYTILLCTVSNLRKEGHDYDVIIHHEFRKNLRSGFLSATWLSRNMITDWRRLFKREGGGLETAFWSESVGNFSSATPASTWSSSLADAHPGPCSLFFFL